MNKQEFLSELSNWLSGFTQDEIDERVNFYSEMIDDRMEEGLSEEEAVRDIGTVDEIVSQIIEETPLVKIVKNKIKPKRKLNAWEIVLLIVGFPVWLPLLIATIAVVLSLYVSLWAVIISLWAAAVAVIGCAIGGIVAGIMFICTENALSGVAMIGAALACGGIAVFMCYGCNAATKGVLKLTKKIAIGIKNLFVRRERAQ
ncbi:MAG: DUF1700 domain-containing protein [Oscillospiraceae bacterium]|nr:DUF1700 domain-containing protein [Oscillospiraceae bacterium]